MDTSIADLAGALGRHVWICLDVVPDWRWMLDRADTPWYDDARLYRQPRAGAWQYVFAEVSACLHQLIPERALVAS